MLNFLDTILIYALPAILAITLHEAAHGYVARLFGDNTAWVLGRVSVNPIVHIDPVGTLLVPGLLLVAGMLSGTTGMLFGWAKPVPVNFSRLRRPKQDMIWVALAGPASNLVQALLWAVLLKLLVLLQLPYSTLNFIAQFAYAGITVNLMLMAFNLLPILPLDGGRILTGLLPWKASMQFSRLEPYGMVILLVLIFSGLLNTFVTPFIRMGQYFVNLVF